MTITRPLDPFSEVVDERRRWTPDWYSWLTDLSQPPQTAISNLTGDVVATGPGSAAATIQPDAVTNAKLDNMPALTLKGNITGGLINPQDLTVVQALALLGVREPLGANRTYFVAPTVTVPTGWSVGNDSNNGLFQIGTPPNGPFATVQRALDITYNTLDLRGFSVTVQLAGTAATPCTYNGSIIITAPQVGVGGISINGNSGSVGSVTLASNAATVTATNGARLTLGNLRVQSGGTPGFCLVGQTGGTLLASGPLIFGSAGAGGSVHMYAADLGTVGTQGFAYTIEGNATQHMLAQTQGTINISNSAITINLPARAFTTFAFASNLSLINAVPPVGGAFTGGGVGGTTGTKYSVSANAVILVNGSGVGYFPGDLGGNFSSGGQYL